MGARIDFDLRSSINEAMTNYATSPGHAVFLLACFALAVTPGPAVIYLVSRTLSRGLSIGLCSIGGVALGNFGNAIAASLGLAMIIAASDRAFTGLKLLGAAYLVYLGVKELRLASGAAHAAGDAGAARAAAPTAALTAALAVAPAAALAAFRDGFWVALLNPKTALFFAAFLPQFIDPEGSPLTQSLALAAVFILVAACTDTLYVLAAARFGPRLAGFGARPEVGRYLAGFSFIALGVFVALAGNRPAK
jgi:threonine/homoserine/homoserine lactone efflux protein